MESNEHFRRNILMEVESYINYRIAVAVEKIEKELKEKYKIEQKEKENEETS